MFCFVLCLFRLIVFVLLIVCVVCIARPVRAGGAACEASRQRHALSSVVVAMGRRLNRTGLINTLLLLSIDKCVMSM
jgi:hypothetical protein